VLSVTAGRADVRPREYSLGPTAAMFPAPSAMNAAIKTQPTHATGVGGVDGFDTSHALCLIAWPSKASSTPGQARKRELDAASCGGGARRVSTKAPGLTGDGYRVPPQRHVHWQL
jgi:hypothetical protein